MMKRLLFLISILVMSCTLTISAQTKKHNGDKSRKEMRQEMEEFKRKFFAQEMELTGEARDKFYEIDKKHSEAVGKCFHEKRAAEKKLKAIAQPTDNDYATYQKTIEAVKVRQEAADKEFDAECKKILSPKQQFKLKEAQEKFRAKMQELKAKKKNRK